MEGLPSGGVSSLLKKTSWEPQPRAEQLWLLSHRPELDMGPAVSIREVGECGCCSWYIAVPIRVVLERRML